MVIPVLLVAWLVAGGLYFRSRHQSKRLTDKDTTVLADFANSTGDAVFDDTLKTALNISELASTVSVLLGKGDGTFQTNIDYVVGKDPIALAIADLNRDGNPDLAVVDSGSDSLSVLLGKGDGTFGTHVDYATGNFPVSIAIADFNADNRQDLAVANQDNAGTVSILFGKGDGTFKTHKDFSAGSQPQGIAVGDFNGDGRLDPFNRRRFLH